MDIHVATHSPVSTSEGYSVNENRIFVFVLIPSLPVFTDTHVQCPCEGRAHPMEAAGAEDAAGWEVPLSCPHLCRYAEMLRETGSGQRGRAASGSRAVRAPSAPPLPETFPGNRDLLLHPHPRDCSPHRAGVCEEHHCV